MAAGDKGRVEGGGEKGLIRVYEEESRTDGPYTTRPSDYLFIDLSQNFIYFKIKYL